jgi:dimethylargininase
MTAFKSAIARRPGRNFHLGLTSVQAAEPPSLELAIEQHARYVEALERCDVRVTLLAGDALADSTFVEDTAVIAGKHAMLARPGAPSRIDEVAAMRETLHRFFDDLAEIVAPGTVDGGDVCEAGRHFYIGISRRTNREGAEQLAAFVRRHGYGASFVDIRDLTSILHLKSGLAYVGDGTFVAIDDVMPRIDFDRHHVIRTRAGEEYGANCIRVNDRVLLAAGHEDLERQLARHGFLSIALDMSEFAKMDGGPSCLSLRF